LRPLIEVSHPQLSARRQCPLLGLHRSSLSHAPAPATAEDLIFFQHFWGTAWTFAPDFFS
jgi:hypothetical protein